MQMQSDSTDQDKETQSVQAEMKKLSLKKRTLRQLTRDELHMAAGGQAVEIAQACLVSRLL